MLVNSINLFISIITGGVGLSREKRPTPNNKKIMIKNLYDEGGQWAQTIKKQQSFKKIA